MTCAAFDCYGRKAFFFYYSVLLLLAVVVVIVAVAVVVVFVAVIAALVGLGRWLSGQKHLPYESGNLSLNN